MPRSRNPDAYTPFWFQLTRTLARAENDLVFNFPTARKAIAFRQDFYAFRRALEHSPNPTHRELWQNLAMHTIIFSPTFTPKARLSALEYAAQLERPTEVRITHRGTDPLALDLARQLEAQAPPPASPPSPPPFPKPSSDPSDPVASALDDFLRGTTLDESLE